MTSPDPLDEARQAFVRQAWVEARAALLAADADRSLDVGDLERLAIANHMLHNVDETTRAWERAHQAALRSGDLGTAVRHAFHLILSFGMRGDIAQAGGWAARAAALAAQLGSDQVEGAYLLIPRALRLLDGGEPAAALALFEEAAASGTRFGESDLTTLGRLGRGQCLIALGHVEAGVALLDEAMLAVTSGEVMPIHAGIVYCASIEAFQAIFDLARATEWTRALSRWCEAQPDAVPFRGRCLVFRAELLQFHGLWQEAIEEARRARDWMTRPPIEPAVGEAAYQQAEVHRLRGEIAAAEREYRQASTWGRRPDPGLALLRLAQGDVGAAVASIRRALDEADELGRIRLLDPCIEIMLSGGDIPSARSAADELLRLAAGFQAQLPRAVAARADGTVRLAAGDPVGALTVLREAWNLWLDLDAPYESARVRVQIGLACRALGDRDAADLELSAARAAFADLGAAPDLARLDALLGEPGHRRHGGLSDREVEVLRLVADGLTNRAIAQQLGISERTVDRHVSNIFTKLDVSSRAAATAAALEHDLI